MPEAVLAMDSARVTVDSVECHRFRECRAVDPIFLKSGMSGVTPSAARLAVGNRSACRFTRDAGVAFRITFRSVGGFSTTVLGAVALCLMCHPRWRRFVLFHGFEL